MLVYAIQDPVPLPCVLEHMIAFCSSVFSWTIGSLQRVSESKFAYFCQISSNFATIRVLMDGLHRYACNDTASRSFQVQAKPEKYSEA